MENERMKNGTDVMIMMMVSGSKNNAWPMTSIVSRVRFGSKLFTMSMRMCSLASNVHDEQSRNTVPNSTHCSSSQAFDDVSKSLRMTALVAETITAARISQLRVLPIRKVTASMTRLSASNAFTSCPLGRSRNVALCHF